jgi:EAL domain-containing protein (putative c-di-GMP-specific phosphodiesterase class I)
LSANSAVKTPGKDLKNISGNGAGSGTEIVKTIVNLARDLGMRAAAEGIETGDQLDRLRELGCTYRQGFFIARPAEAATAQALLAKRLQGQEQRKR